MSTKQQVKRKKEEEENDGDMMEESDDENMEAIRFDNVLEEEGTEEVDFDFDDPQVKHFDSIRGVLLRGTIGKCISSRELNALSEIVAMDPASSGTVVEVADNEVVCFAAVINLQHYPVAANTGVDSIRTILSQASSHNLRQAANSKRIQEINSSYAFLARGYLLNVPPRVVAATYRLLRNDLTNMQPFRGFILLVRGEDPASTIQAQADSGVPAKKHATTVAQYDSFDDDCFVAAASEHFPLSSLTPSSGRLTAIYLDAPAFSAAIDEIIHLAEL